MSFRSVDRKIIHVRDKPNFRSLVVPSVSVPEMCQSDDSSSSSEIVKPTESDMPVKINISDPMDAQTFIDACHLLANKSALDVETKKALLRGLTTHIFRIMRLKDEIRNDVSTKLTDLMNQANHLDPRIAGDYIPTVLGNMMGVVTSAKATK